MALASGDLRLKFELLLSRLNAMKNESEVALALDNFLLFHGYDVTIGQMPHGSLIPNGRRHYLVTFKFPEQAVNFANNVGRPTFGYNSVVLEFD